MTGWREMYRRIRARLLLRPRAAPAPEPPRYLLRKNAPPAPGFLRARIRESLAWRRFVSPRRRRRE